MWFLRYASERQTYRHTVVTYADNITPFYYH